MVHKCPVCNGVGSMPSDFYNPPMPNVVLMTLSGGPMREMCRACYGRGVVFDVQPPAVAWPWDSYNGIAGMVETQH